MCPVCVTTITTIAATGGLGLLAGFRAIRAFTRRRVNGPTRLELVDTKVFERGIIAKALRPL